MNARSVTLFLIGLIFITGLLIPGEAPAAPLCAPENRKRRDCMRVVRPAFEPNVAPKIVGYPSGEGRSEHMAVVAHASAVPELEQYSVAAHYENQSLYIGQAPRTGGVHPVQLRHDWQGVARAALLTVPSTSTNADKVVYLTFDDGPSVWTPRILAVLARYNARATFFVIGRQVPAYANLIREAARAGSTFANHTYNHPSLKGISRAAFQREIRATSDTLGPYATRCLRPPYGAMDAHTWPYARELGYRIVLWDIDPRDWTPLGAEAIATHVLQRVSSGKVVLLHDGGGNRSQTLAALELILPQLHAQGYRFEPVCR